MQTCHNARLKAQLSPSHKRRASSITTVCPSCVIFACIGNCYSSQGDKSTPNLILLFPKSWSGSCPEYTLWEAKKYSRQIGTTFLHRKCIRKKQSLKWNILHNQVYFFRFRNGRNFSHYRNKNITGRTYFRSLANYWRTRNACKRRWTECSHIRYPEKTFNQKLAHAPTTRHVVLELSYS